MRKECYHTLLSQFSKGWVIDVIYHVMSSCCAILHLIYRGFSQLIKMKYKLCITFSGSGVMATRKPLICIIFYSYVHYYGAKLHIGNALSVCLSVRHLRISGVRTGWMDFHEILDKITLRSCIVASLSRPYDHTHQTGVKWDFKFWRYFMFFGQGSRK